MNKWKYSILAIIVVLVLAVVGYSFMNKPQTNSSSSSSSVTDQAATSSKDNNQIVNPDPKYVGADNLAKYESIAQKNPNSPTAQFDAAVSAFVNKDYNKSADYYKKAVALAPKNALYLTNLGNVYFRGLNNPQQASTYYQQAVQSDPTYANGWWNYAICQIAQGDKAGAKATLQKGISSVSAKDPLLDAMKKELDSIK